MPMTVRHDPGLGASPQVWHKLEVERRRALASFVALIASAASLAHCGNESFSAVSGDAGGDAGGGGEAGAEAGGDASAKPSSNYRSTVLADHPAAYWRLGEAAPAATANDESGHVHVGTYGGAVVFSVPGAIVGDSNPAVHLDGTTAFVSCGSIFQFPGSASFSLEAWVRPMDNGGVVSVILAQNADPDGYALSVMPATAFASFARQASGRVDLVQGPALTSSSYTYLVATYDGTVEQLFVNGAVQAPVPSGAILGASSSFFIGTDALSTADRFKGDVDEAAVYDYALTAAQVLAHYKAGLGL